MAMIIKDTTKERESFVGKPKKISWERLWAFSGGPFRLEGWPSKNIHTDLPFARDCGLPSVAASATQYMGYMAQLMIDLFGVEWFWHGTMDVKFIDIVDAGDLLVSKAVVKSKEAAGGATKFTMDVWCENQRGAKVLVGFTTGIIGGKTSWRVEDYNNRVAELRAGSTTQQAVPGRTELEPLEYVVTPELNQQYLYSEEDFHLRYIEETESGPPIVHPALIFNMSNSTRSPSYQVPSGQAGFHSRDETFFCNPARVGKRIKVTWKLVGSYEKRGRPYSVNEILITNEDGLEIMRRLSHGTIASQEYRKEYRK